MSLNICVLINNIYIYYISVLYVVQSVYIAYSTYVYCTLARIHSNVTNSNPIRPNVNEVSALSSATATAFDRDAYRLIYSAIYRGRVALQDALTGQPLVNPLLAQRQAAS